MVSVVMPVKDAAETLDEAVASVVAQEFGDWEMVVVDNGSTDASAEFAREWARREERIRVMEVGGTIVDALREGVEASRGEIIARMDADDIAHPRRFGRQVEWLRHRPGLMTCGTAVEICRRDRSGAWQPPLAGFGRFAEWIAALDDPATLARQRFIESPLVHPTVMMRRAAYVDAGGYREPPGGWAEDYDLWLRMLEMGMAVENLPEPLLTWVDGDRRLTRSDGRYSQERFLAAKAHFIARLPNAAAGFWLAGGGPIRKGLGRFLRREGALLHGVFDVSPRRIGESWQGLPVEDAATLSHARHGGILLGAVGLPGAREKLRELAAAAGYTEGVDFFLCA